MNTEKVRSSVLFSLCMVAVVSAVSFGNFIPIFGGVPGSTHQVWEFNTDANPAVPDVVNNPNGDPLATIEASDPSEMEWIAEDRGHVGVWGIMGDLKLYIPNTDNTDPGSSKTIIIQMIYDAGAGSDAWIRYSADGQPLSTGIAPTLTEDLGDGYTYGLWEFEISPNPTEEVIYALPFYCDLFVDSISVDTICVPEPATMAILGLGSLLVIRRKRA